MLRLLVWVLVLAVARPGPLRLGEGDQHVGPSGEARPSLPRRAALERERNTYPLDRDLRIVNCELRVASCSGRQRK